jgi:hypothetical protein
MPTGCERRHGGGDRWDREPNDAAPVRTAATITVSRTVCSTPMLSAVLPRQSEGTTMSVSSGTVPFATSLPKRALLFVLPAALGVAIGIAWNPVAAATVYTSFLGTFLNPSAQIASLALAMAVGFVVGFTHIAHI